MLFSNENKKLNYIVIHNIVRALFGLWHEETQYERGVVSRTIHVDVDVNVDVEHDSETRAG